MDVGKSSRHRQSRSTADGSATRCSSDTPSSEMSSSNDVIKLDNRLPTPIKLTITTTATTTTAAFNTQFTVQFYMDLSVSPVSQTKDRIRPCAHWKHLRGRPTPPGFIRYAKTPARPHPRLWSWRMTDYSGRPSHWQKAMAER